MFCIILTHSAIYEPLTLDDETFEWQTKESPITFVLASRPDISFCQEVLPKFRAVAEILKDHVQFVILDAESSNQTRAKWSIFAYPAFYVFRYGNLTAEYVDERDAEHMLRYLQRIVQDPVQVLESARDVSDFQQEYIANIILAGEEIDSELLDIFKEVAARWTDQIVFSYANDGDAIQQLGLEETPSLKLYRDQDRTTIDFPLAFGLTVDTFSQWITDNIVPRYRRRDSIAFRDLMYDQRLTLLGFVDTNRPKSLDVLHDVMSSAVDEYGENFTYVYADVYDMGAIILHLGFSGAREPCFALVKLSNGEISTKYLFPERRDPTSQSVNKWLAQFQNATATQTASRSEPDPGDQSKKAVKTLVGTTFLEHSHTPKRDVLTLILFGDPTSYETTLTVFTAVAEELQKQKVKTVDFCTVDIEKNDTPGLRIPKDMKEPSIVLWPAGKETQPILVPGDLDERGLMNAIMTHCTTKPKFKIPATLETGSLDL